VDRRPPRLALFAEVDANLIDGSSVWLQSVALLLAERAEVTVLLRVAERRDVLTAPLRAHPRITLLDPGIEPPDVRVLPPASAVERIEWLDAEQPFNAILLRGDGVAEVALSRQRLLDRLALFHLPPAGAGPADDVERLRRWARAHRVLCQTEALRDATAEAVPELRGRLGLLPPVVDDDLGAVRARPPQSPRRLVYAGKLAPEYRFEEMLELFQRFREHHPEAELHVAGDKVHDPAADPGFRTRAQAALAATPGLTHHGALPRERVAALLTECDVAFAMRTPALGASSELSTKVLEYGAAGTPPLLSRSPVHEALLGANYPLYAEDVPEALDVLERAAVDPALLAEAARCAGAAVAPYRRSAVAGALDLAALAPDAPPPPARPHPSVVVATHSRAFLAPLLGHLERRGHEVRFDTWLRHAVHVGDVSRQASEWASTVVCEWCVGNAVWHATHRRAGQRLIVRMHRMEVETPYPGELDLERVDAMVFVADHIRDAACERFGWSPSDRLQVIPNSIDLDRLDRPKLPGAEFTLAVVGFVPAFKRLDRALDLLERLRAADERFRLRCKGHMPWELAGLLRRPADRAFFEAVFDRIHHAPLLRDAVHFEPFGDDVDGFLAEAGWIVSTSDDEGHAVGLAEGMAARCAPVILDRPGAVVQYGKRWVHGDATAAADWVLAVQARGGRRHEGETARIHASAWSWEALAPSWDAVLGLEG
jgi:glycosyltransferase involved in cell wall biosynthesis